MQLRNFIVSPENTITPGKSGTANKLSDTENNTDADYQMKLAQAAEVLEQGELRQALSAFKEQSRQ